MRDLASLGISPAPWKFIPGDDMSHAGIDDAKGGWVIETAAKNIDTENADARLIASAPSLYEALRGLLEIVCDDCKSWYGDSREKCKGCPRVKTARAALAAASGESEVDK